MKEMVDVSAAGISLFSSQGDYLVQMKYIEIVERLKKAKGHNPEALQEKLRFLWMWSCCSNRLLASRISVSEASVRRLNEVFR